MEEHIEVLGLQKVVQPAGRPELGSLHRLLPAGIKLSQKPAFV